MTTRTRAIQDVAEELGIDPRALTTLGPTKAKLDPHAEPANGSSTDGALVLVSAITPTRFGEGKTTVSVGLADGLRRVGARACLALREPSLGPVFGMKGGGTGGGRAQVVPADDINLHFTGDLHAIGAAHNLLAAMIDTELHFGARDGGTVSGIDPTRVTWPRVLDMNDRALRRVVLDVGGRAERSSRFDITAASEVMATLALATSLEDLRERLARTVVGWRDDGSPVTTADVAATEAMVALLRDALRPNLVQTGDGTPALVHCGPFANIAHGCSSVLATRLALRHAEVVVTEAGFGFDLGGEKFLHLKAPQGGVWPRCVVLVSTVRALAHHGEGHLGRGLGHLDRHVAIVRSFGLPVVVALNVFADDDEADLVAIETRARDLDVAAARCTAFAEGGGGGVALAAAVREQLRLNADDPPQPRSLYGVGAPVEVKLRALARCVYGASDVAFSEQARADLERIAAAGFGTLPVCVAKTHLSFTDDPKGGGLATCFTPTVTEVRLAAGAGFVVALMGRIFTMPGLPRDPAARHVRVDPNGRVRGLMQAG
jgi:formate--tetrahydrofolate ligase